MTRPYPNSPTDIADDVPGAASNVDLPDARESPGSSGQSRLIGSVLESSTEYSIIATDPQGVILLWNQGAQRLYGYEPAEVVGKHKSLLHREEDVLNGLPQKMMDGAREDGKWTGWVQRVRKDGSSFTARVALTPRCGPRGAFAGFLLMSSDVTDELRLAGELERSKAYTRSVLEASRLKSEFMANMSHEIRTPLNGIVGMTELLRDTSLDPVQLEYADGLVASNTALLAIVEDILDYSKLEAKHVVLDSTDFDLRGAVREACVVFDREACSKGLQISWSVDADLPVTVTGDQPCLRQILSNLLSNAVKFSASGEIAVRVVGDGGAAVRFEVSDDGIGIDDRESAQLFDAFVQGDGSSTRLYGGTGIGLTIARELVELMNGKIGASSREPRGSVFWFTAELPQVIGVHAGIAPCEQ